MVFFMTFAIKFRGGGEGVSNHLESVTEKKLLLEVFPRIIFSHKAMRALRHTRFPEAESKLWPKRGWGIFQKMKNDITLRGDTSSQLDFNLAPQDIVLNCSDGQVRSIFVACQLN